MQWDAIEGASKYAIAEYIDGTYKTFTLDCKDTSYTVSNLANGYQHSFLVQAYVNGKWSAYSSANHVSATPHGTVKPTARVTSATSNSIALNWNMVPGAERYAIAIKADNGTYKTFTFDCKGTSYTIGNLASNKSYRILVQACINGKWSAFSDADLIKGQTK